MLKFRYWWLSVLIIIFAIGGFFYFRQNQPKTGLISPLASIKPAEFSVAEAPSQSLRGKITTMTGEIKWQSRTATEAAKLDSPITIQQGEKLITGADSNLTLIFSGAGSITLDENTELEISQTLPEHLVFNQASGGGNFTGTMAIRLNHLLIQIDGNLETTFDQKTPIIVLTLKSGQATAAYNDLDYLSHKRELTAGRTLTFNDDTRQAVVK